MKHRTLWAGLAGTVTATIGVTVWAMHSPPTEPSEAKTTSVKAQSKETDALLQSGLQRQMQQDSAGAAKIYRRVLELDPKAKEAWYRLGLIEQQNGAPLEARRDFDKALKIDPSFTSALYSEANMVAASEPDRAIELLTRAVAANPKASVMQLQLGLLLAKKGDEDEAENAFRQAVAADHHVLPQVPESFRDQVSPAPASSHARSTE